MSLLFAIVLINGKIDTIYLQNLSNEKECRESLNTMQRKYSHENFVGACLKGLDK